MNHEQKEVIINSLVASKSWLRGYAEAYVEDAMTKTPDPDRQARSRQARAEAGGKQIAVMLTPAAAAKLAAWVARGETIAGVVNRLLSRSKP